MMIRVVFLAGFGWGRSWRYFRPNRGKSRGEGSGTEAEFFP
jgi:hypothetical protein